MKFLVLNKEKTNIYVCNRIFRHGVDIYGYKVDKFNVIREKYLLGRYKTETQAKVVIEDIFEDIFDLEEKTYVMPEDEDIRHIEKFE